MDSPQAQMLANRVKKRLKHLKKWAKRMNFEAFRLYDRDIPEIPLVLDLYGDIISGALYKRPYEKDPAEEAVWLESMREALSQSTGIAPENVIIKQRERQTGLAQYEKTSERGIFREIYEGKYKFKVNLSDYLDTGLFLDRRTLRSLVGADANGKRVLNLFCYTASFSVYAAGGGLGDPCGSDPRGAISVDSVDLSNTYLGWARENFALNGFDAKQFRMEELGVSHPKNRLIRADVNAFLERAAAGPYRWDSIILDPPAFSNSKMSRADFDLNRDYETLLAACLALLSPNGKLWFSASARSFKPGAKELEQALGVKVADITDKIVDEDFKGKKTPKTFLLGL
jgi:23S rRNA G2069 N7-methylase RlmK/C1962 C5-methylase RlmI